MQEPAGCPRGCTGSEELGASPGAAGNFRLKIPLLVKGKTLFKKLFKSTPS